MNTIVILPTYNEAENIAKIIKKLLDLNIENFGILVVDDNSPDGTGQIVNDLAQANPEMVSILHREGRMGLGSAYRRGFEWALENGADAVLQMDSDFSHPAEKIPEMLGKLKDFDIVIGSRYTPGGSVDVDWPTWRKWLSAFGNFYARTILGLPLRDVTGGFRLWRRSALQAMPMDKIRSNGYVFQVETAYAAYKVGLQFGETPIYFADRKWGQSKMNWRIQLEAAWRVWQVLFTLRNLS
ncbi:MAG: polyprenol monophosphomannose synthase [Chloroflexota bacterium]